MIKLDFVEFTGAEVKKESIKGIPANFRTRIDIVDTDVKDEKLNLTFSYTVQYAPETTHITLYGLAGFSGEEIKKGFEMAKKTKKFPDEVRNQILTGINHVCSTNSVFIARVFNLAPPVVPALIEG